jgi:flagellar biosynthesis/type III secretory pathway M-ring protein FliF/YscJ
VTASRSRPYVRVLVLMELSLEANTGATLARMKPKAILATALLMVALVVAILVAWIIWRPEVMGV